MADDKSNTGPPDRDRINFNEDYESLPRMLERRIRTFAAPHGWSPASWWTPDRKEAESAKD